MTPDDDNPTPTAWSCSGCGTSDLRLHYRSGKMPRCYTCQAFANVVTNARQKHGKKAAKGTTRQVEFTREQFLAWAVVNPRLCQFCHIDDGAYWQLNMASANGLRLEALGIDRLENDLDYTLSNIGWCCYPCNRAKGNVYTVAEMRTIGAGIEQVWRARLSAPPPETP